MQGSTMTGTCRICDEPATQSIGEYAFCERHFERASRERRGGWQADVASIVLLVGFVAVVFAIDELVRPRFTGTALTLIGLVLAVVPAVIWLAFFYRRDRLEPEPRTMVLGEFVLGLLVATAIAIPIVEQAFDVGSWLFASPLVHLAGGILIVGIVQEGLKYLTVRLSVYGSREFDERTDGIIYGTAVGLGFATALNVAFVVESGGVDLGTGAIRIVLTSLAHASFGGVIGYFLGRQKFESRPIWWVPAGVALAATFNGIFFFLRSTVGRGTIEDPLQAVAPWIGLLLAAVIAAVITAVLSALIRRELAQVGAGSGAEASS
ncbi:MAG: PrsW family glutamic-type intramembrane protease [Chloroflexota bacterium]